MKGISKNSRAGPENWWLVWTRAAGFWIHPGCTLWKQCRWYRYNLQAGVYTPTRVATREKPLVPDRARGFFIL